MLVSREIEGVMEGGGDADGAAEGTKDGEVVVGLIECGFDEGGFEWDRYSEEGVEYDGDDEVARYEDGEEDDATLLEISVVLLVPLPSYLLFVTYQVTKIAEVTKRKTEEN